jgi:transcriptional regulator with XRE-family HTH domain
MGRIISEARRLRFELQALEARRISIQEVADAIGVDRRVVMNIELGRTVLFDAEIMRKLGDFYTQRGLDATRILRYDPTNRRATILEEVALSPA